MNEETRRLVERLRSEARYAYLDGKLKRAKKLNKEADVWESIARKDSKKESLNYDADGVRRWIEGFR